jgi:hypothetical protein
VFALLWTFIINFFLLFFTSSFTLSLAAYCTLHAEALHIRKAVEGGGKKMAPFEAAKAVMKNIRNFFAWPARNAELRVHQASLHLPQHQLVAYGKTRFLTLGDAAVRLFEQLAAVIRALRAYLEKHKAEAKVCRLHVHVKQYMYILSLLLLFCFFISARFVPQLKSISGG